MRTFILGSLTLCIPLVASAAPPQYHDGKNTLAAIKAMKLPARIERRALAAAAQILQRNPFGQPNDQKTWGHEVSASGQIGGYRERTDPLFGKERVYVRTATESSVSVRAGTGSRGPELYIKLGQGPKDRVGTHQAKDMEYAVYRNDKGQLIESLRYRKDGQHRLRRDFAVDAAGKRTKIGQW